MNVEDVLRAISPENPAGEDLEYDVEYQELQRLVDLRFTGGEPIDWKTAAEKAEALLDKSKHLGIAVLLSRALANIGGWSGFYQGVQVVTGFIEQFWDDIFPLLDPEDNNDPAMRINILSDLCDREATLVSLLDAPVVQLKGLGTFSLRDYKIANGELEPPKNSEKDPVDIQLIEAAFREGDASDIKVTREIVDNLLLSLKKLDGLLIEKVGSNQSLDLTPLNKIVVDAQKCINASLADAGDSKNEGEASLNEDDVSGTVGENRAQLSDSVVDSREGAARMMDAISEYFIKNEPSSPVPLLMQRAKRLSTMGFMEILKDIAPDGLKQAQNVGGEVLEEKK